MHTATTTSIAIATTKLTTPISVPTIIADKSVVELSSVGVGPEPVEFAAVVGGMVSSVAIAAMQRRLQS